MACMLGYEIVDFEPGRRLVMRTAEGPFPMESTYTWQPHPSGGTTMTLRNRGEPAGFARFGAPAMSTAMRRANRRDLARLKIPPRAAHPTASEAVTDTMPATAPSQWHHRQFRRCR